MEVRIWTDHNAHSVFAESAKQARQWEIDISGSEEWVSPVEEWESIDPDVVLTIGFEDLEGIPDPLPEGCQVTHRDGGYFRVKATAQAWVDQHIQSGGAIPDLHASSEW